MGKRENKGNIHFNKCISVPDITEDEIVLHSLKHYIQENSN